MSKTKPKKRPKKEERRFGVWWVCLSCEGKPEYEHKDFIKHLQEIHNIDTKTAKGTQQMTMHMDGPDWFSSTYEVTLNDLKFTKYTCTKRDKSDPYSMMHE